MTDIEIFQKDYYYLCGKIKKCSNHIEFFKRDYRHPTKNQKSVILNWESALYDWERQLNKVLRQIKESEGK